MNGSMGNLVWGVSSPNKTSKQLAQRNVVEGYRCSAAWTRLICIIITLLTSFRKKKCILALMWDCGSRIQRSG